MALPDGYAIELLDETTERYLLVQSPSRYFVTIDLDLRRLGGGTGKAVAFSATSKIDAPRRTGRGWREAIIGDAVAHLQKLEATR